MAAPRRKTASASGARHEDDVDRKGSTAGFPHYRLSKTSLPSPKQRPSTRAIFLKVLALLAPPVLLTTGLAIFTQSFFLSRTSFEHRSSCKLGSAGTLLQTALGLEPRHVDYLRRSGFLTDDDIHSHNGCWVPRRVDSMAILVVDALRFDFARDHLPLSIGSRLFPSQNGTANHHASDTSRLYQFVADPPTVTMQRLKGLTTGGLPTFADISGSFGGASIEEDSWVEQLKSVPWGRRHNSHGEMKILDEHPRIAFVGDDTWVDLFPTQFDDCHPFPSFNTRDLDTVDNGCLEHLPRLLGGLLGRTTTSKNQEATGGNSTSLFELIVAHFLGVDHVGHTYGPNNPHMESKLHQMDVMLSNTLDVIDAAPTDSCIVALVLGDHGMTEDGNHGGGTEEEVNAGLFVHFSPGCQDEGEREDKITGEEIPGSAHTFESIHQIDLVPTISFLLGLPVPYANIGGLVPDLLPTPKKSIQHPSHATAHTATALALNSAQVWDYLDTYSKTSRDLPMDHLRELKETLDSATLLYRDAISHSEKLTNSQTGDDEEEHTFFDSMPYRQACALFKIFLAESTDLGKRVWTQFNERGMMIGIGILIVAWIMAAPLWKESVRNELKRTLFSLNGSAQAVHLSGKKEIIGGIKENVKRENDGSVLSLKSSLESFHRLEVMAAILFMIFQCGVLTFGNSYIDHEWEIVTFFLSVLCLLVFRRWYFVLNNQARSFEDSIRVYLPLIVALCSRTNDVLVTGHGLDPSIRLHVAHHPIAFLSSLFVLVSLRIRWLTPFSKGTGRNEIRYIPFSSLIDIIATVCLGGSWWEKRSLDQSRNGFIMARLAIWSVFVGLTHSIYCLVRGVKISNAAGIHRKNVGSFIENTQLALFRAMLFLVIVTGPSAASTAVLVVIQCAALQKMMLESNGTREVNAPVMAAMWRLAMRHVFFATNHHCSFNRLQYSAAFVATGTFQFHIAGSSLFMNTFGWEILGSSLVLAHSRSCQAGLKNRPARSNVW
eukprot:CAMPEP_0183721204 /NCGR_PEP_ID=MMETSP0737-20130205/13555_1 /TAXON_ID=385413 /ORGANISM="Thalassiosira miniscula, Strain CCMP1093" /LENGTH=998 /DNA_ID=CAMNT_0025951175 /DNA_START=202 /DNA_END=3195 /DNA_ORIENTATION=-